MRRITSILLLFTLAFPFALRIGIVGNYIVNKTYYATVLCQNKDNTELDCEGSCQLKEELNEIEQPIANSRKIPVSERFEISAFIIHNCYNVFIPPSNCTVLYNWESNQLMPNPISDFFQPPESIRFS
ncbi:MAG: hypothetical protein ACO1PI_16460 [Bacteroidota bacterium]